jgi:hypothetical protein
LSVSCWTVSSKRTFDRYGRPISVVTSAGLVGLEVETAVRVLGDTLLSTVSGEDRSAARAGRRPRASRPRRGCRTARRRRRQRESVPGEDDDLDATESARREQVREPVDLLQAA